MSSNFKPAVVVVIATMVTSSHCQPTVIDFDYCADSATLRHMARTVDILAQQTKTLSLAVKKIEDSEGEQLSKVTDAAEKLEADFDAWMSDIVEEMDKMSTGLEVNIRKDVKTLESKVDLKLEEVKQEVRESLLNQSEGVLQLFRAIQNATSGEEFDLTSTLERLTLIINTTMVRPLSSLMTSEMSLIEQAHTATHRLESQMKENIVSFEEIFERKTDSVSDQLKQALEDTVRELVSKLNGRKSADLSGILDLYKSDLKIEVGDTVRNVSAVLGEKILGQLLENKEEFTLMLTGLDVTGRFDTIKQLITSNELCPSKIVIESIRGATYVQEGKGKIKFGF